MRNIYFTFTPAGRGFRIVDLIEWRANELDGTFEKLLFAAAFPHIFQDKELDEIVDPQ